MRKQLLTLLYTASCGLSALMCHGQAYSNAVMALNPVGYYPLNETSQPPDAVVTLITNYGTDTSLNLNVQSDVIYGNTGALASQTNDSSDYFNGGTSFAAASFSPDLETGPSFSIEGWFKSDNVSATQCPVADIDVGPNTPSIRSGWLIYMDIANQGQYQFRTYDTNGTSTSLQFNIGGAGSIVQGKWYHLAVVVDSSGGTTNVSGYINGQLVAGPTVLPAFVPNDGGDGGLTVGARSDGGFLFQGQIDELAYYTNALNAATVLSHYQAGTNLSPATAYTALVQQQKPLAYYRFNEATPPLASPYPVALPVAHNYGSLGAAANGFYTSGAQPGSVPGPTNAGLNGLPALELNPTDTESFTTAGPGVFAAPFDTETYDASNAFTVTFWAEVSTNAPTYFETVLGRGDNSWRFDVDPTGNPHWAAAPNGDLVGPTPLLDNAWHYWAGVFDPVSGVGTLYIDAAEVAEASWSDLSPNSQYPLLIGGAPDYWNGARNFSGNIAQVAIYNAALTPSQVNSLYAAAGAAATASVPVSTITNDAGTDFSITATAGGSAPLTTQWYVVDTSVSPNVTNEVAGATLLTLSFTNTPFSLNGFEYFIVASNSLGVATSGIVTLYVLQGPPIITSYIAPSSLSPIGIPDTFSVAVNGSAPFFYHWFQDNSVIPGATNSTYNFNVLSGVHTYDVVISNAFGPTTSAVATVTGSSAAAPTITFDNGLDWSSNSVQGAVGFTYPFVTNNVWELTDGNGSEASSIFYCVPQYIASFVADFTYTGTNINGATPADGVTFLVQNSSAGTNALGGGGGDLGYTGIGNSLAFEINIYTGANGGAGIQYGTGGATPDSTTPTGPYIVPGTIVLYSGDPIHVHLVYTGGVMSATLTDTVSGATYSGSHTFGSVDSIVGSEIGYVGFTGGTGGDAANQTVGNFSFSYTTPAAGGVTLAATSAGGNIVITWPTNAPSSLKLQQSTVVTGPYSDSSATSTVVNGQNQVTVPESGSAAFFRLGSN